MCRHVSTDCNIGWSGSRVCCQVGAAVKLEPLWIHRYIVQVGQETVFACFGVCLLVA